jgi:hypothetical protein
VSDSAIASPRCDLLSVREGSDGCGPTTTRPGLLSPGSKLPLRALLGLLRRVLGTPEPPWRRLYGLWRGLQGLLSLPESFVREAGARRVSQRPPLRFGTRRPHHSPDLQPLRLYPCSGDLLGGVRLLHGCAPASLMSSNLYTAGRHVK